ncbi:MAG: isoprenyl transferase [Coriobacteriia bacterium]
MTDTPRRASLEDFFRSRTDRELLGRLDIAQVPPHVAIIMDGNGRWAAKRALPRQLGHKAGAKAVRESIATCLELGIRYLTIYSFSSENWRRSAEEVSGLMSLFVEVLEAEMDNLMAKRVRVRLIGSDAGVPDKTMSAFRNAERATADNDRLTLVVALNYGGRLELTDAMRSLAREVADGRLSPDEITESTLAEHLYTRDIPDPDLLVRTSGEMRVSNFLLWQIAYSEIWVTSVLWPDFRRGDLLRAVVDFQRRSRRFGGR